MNHPTPRRISQPILSRSTICSPLSSPLAPKNSIFKKAAGQAVVMAKLLQPGGELWKSSLDSLECHFLFCALAAARATIMDLIRFFTGLGAASIIRECWRWLACIEWEFWLGFCSWWTNRAQKRSFDKVYNLYIMAFRLRRRGTESHLLSLYYPATYVSTSYSLYMLFKICYGELETFWMVMRNEDKTMSSI